MQIPFGNNSGQALPNSPGPVSIPRGAFDTSSGLIDLGQKGMQLAADNQRIDLEQKQMQQRAQAAVTMQQATNDIYAAHDDVARGVSDGSIDPGEAATKLQDRVEQIKSSSLGDLSPFQKQIVDDHVVRIQGSVDRSLQDVIFKRNQSDTAGAIDQFGELAQRDAARIGPEAAAEKFSALVDFSGSAAGWTPQQQADRKQAFKEKVSYGFYQAAGLKALTEGNVEGVTAVMHNVQDNDAIDPVKKNQLTHQLFGYQQSLIAQQERDKNLQASMQIQREKAAETEYTRGWELATSGGKFSPDYIKQFTEATSGTSYARAALLLLASQKESAGFASKTADERAAIIERYRSDAADPAKGTDPDTAKAVAFVESMNAKIDTAVNDNPWAAAQKYGRIKDAPILDFTNLASLRPALQQRMTQIDNVEAFAGHKVSPLQPKEAETIARGIRSMPLDQQATALEEIGTYVPDADRVALIAKQIGDKDGILGLSMSYANSHNTQGRTASLLLLKGEQAVRDKSIKFDGTIETGWKATAASMIRGAYASPELEDQIIHASMLIMAARSTDRSQGNVTIKNAVQLATGGIIDFNGSKIPLPYGMSGDPSGDPSIGEKKFKTAINAITPANLSTQAPDGLVRIGNASMPLDQFVKTLPDARLLHAGQGLYSVQAGNTLVTNSSGRRIILEVLP